MLFIALLFFSIPSLRKTLRECWPNPGLYFRPNDTVLNPLIQHPKLRAFIPLHRSNLPRNYLSVSNSVENIQKGQWLRLILNLSPLWCFT